MIIVPNTVKLRRESCTFLQPWHRYGVFVRLSSAFSVNCLRVLVRTVFLQFVPTSVTQHSDIKIVFNFCYYIMHRDPPMLFKMNLQVSEHKSRKNTCRSLKERKKEKRNGYTNACPSIEDHTVATLGEMRACALCYLHSRAHGYVPLPARPGIRSCDSVGATPPSREARARPSCVAARKRTRLSVTRGRLTAAPREEGRSINVTPVSHFLLLFKPT